MVYTFPFLLAFVSVFAIVFIIHYISQTYLLKKKEFKTSRSSILILLVQSAAITALLYIF